MKINNSEWISISDLMSGLMMIFLFVAIALLIPEKNENKYIKEAIDKSKHDVNKLNSALDSIFKEDFSKWGAVRLRDGTVRFQEPKIMFSPGSHTISYRFKKILNVFCPRYVRLLKNNFRDEIHEIRVVGHSSSEWKTNNLMIRSLKNIKLSSDRSLDVYSFCYKSMKSNRKWFTEKTISVGAGFVHRIKNNRKEIRWMSRRVEFRVQMKSVSNLEELLRGKNW